MLPVEKTKIENSINKQIFMVYGRPKIGKSTFCSQFPSPLFLATEPGLNHLECYRVIVNSWDKFLEACGDIAKGGHKFQTIVIDTFDNLIDLCAEWVCKEKGIEHVADLPMGKGYGFVNTHIRQKINKLAQLGYAVILVSHCDLVEVETKTKKFNKYTISVSGRNKGFALGLPDYILFIDSIIKDNEEVRLIRTKPSMYWDAGDRSNKLPAELPLSFTELAKYFKQEEVV